jgi:hypothetical protein
LLVCQATTRCTVSLLGGGYGCFHLDFTASKGDDSILENAILNDNRFQSLLNDLNAHAVLVITKNISRTYCAVHEVKLAFATNRDLQTPSYNIEDGVTGLFGAEGSEDTTYGLAEVDVQDLTKGQSKGNLLKRVWRLLTVTSHQLRIGQGRTIFKKFDRLTSAEFERVVSEFQGAGALAIVHGYANTFDDALKSTCKFVHQSIVDKLKILPVLFS